MGQKGKEIVEIEVKEVISDLNSVYAGRMVGALSILSVCSNRRRNRCGDPEEGT